MIDTFVNVGNGIFTSSKNFCGNLLFVQKTLHIFRSDHPHYSCGFVAQYPPQDMVIEYRDGESLIKSNLILTDIAAFFRGEERVLVHCMVGQTRSPTIALIGKIARGVNVWTALADIVSATWQQRHIVCNLCITPLQEIFEWAGEDATSLLRR